jgi:dCMP deaminase
MEKLGLTSEEFDEIEKREITKKDSDICKLDVIRCIDTADIVIQNNNNNGPDALFWKLLRYTALILEPGSIKPSDDETLMHIAYTLSVKSNCLSRQVGAVIVNSSGYIIGAGWNDVGEGQLSCGIKMGKDYGNTYLKNDNIKIKSEEGNRYICVKNKIRESISVKNKLNEDKQKEPDEVFCPVLHAEENAILQLAQYSSGVIKDGTIYSTTFPCSSCFRKISQVGIVKVIYSESYVNPLLELYIRQSIKRIDPVPFEGVKSFSYYKLFKPYYDKKEQQLLLGY